MVGAATLAGPVDFVTNPITEVVGGGEDVVTELVSSAHQLSQVLLGGHGAQVETELKLRHGLVQGHG